MKKFKSYFVLSFIAILSLICSSCTIEKDEEFNNSSSISVDGNKYFIYQSLFNKNNTGDVYFSAILRPDIKESERGYREFDFKPMFQFMIRRICYSIAPRAINSWRRYYK